MSWLRIDDGFTEHHKIVALKRGDRWTWVELLTYCARQNDGGRVPNGISDVLRWITPTFLARCLQLGLLEVDDGGYRVHDWDDYNTPRITTTEVVGRVREVLARHPHASGNDIARMVGGRRRDVLAAVAELRPTTPILTKSVPGNQLGTSTEPVPVPVPGTTREPVRAPAAPKDLELKAKSFAGGVATGKDSREGRQAESAEPPIQESEIKTLGVETIGEDVARQLASLRALSGSSGPPTESGRALRQGWREGDATP